MSEEVVAKEVAEAEFDRFAESMDLDTDKSLMSADDISGFEKLKNRIIKNICRGSLVINDNGEAVYTPTNPRSGHKEPIVFHERSGASLMAMDGKGRNKDAAKTYAVMGDLCKLQQSVFAGLVGTDIKVCEALFALLMD